MYNKTEKQLPCTSWASSGAEALNMFCGQIMSIILQSRGMCLLVFPLCGFVFLAKVSLPPSVDYQPRLFPAICCLLRWSRMEQDGVGWEGWGVSGSSGCTEEEEFDVNYPPDASIMKA